MNEYLETICAFCPLFFLTMHKRANRADSTPVLIRSRARRWWQTDMSKVKINASASAKAEIFNRFGILGHKKVCVLSGGGHTNMNTGVESTLGPF